MIAKPGIDLPSADALGARIATATRGDQRHWADAAAITTALFGDAVTANLFVVGMAVQAGCLPIAPEAIERAIELNGVAIERNRAAFRWGRRQIANPGAVREAAAEHTAGMPARVLAPLPRPLEERVSAAAGGDENLATRLRLLTSDLVAYQDRRYAEGFLATVTEVAERESAVAPGSTRLTVAVARGLHKLLAYKDEYEVARLMLLDEGLAPARGIAGDEGRIAWRLHPPLLRALGLKRKLAVGTWAAPGFRLLAAAKRLRGSRLDPFGRTRIRRLERELPGEYRAAVCRLLADLKPELLDDAVAIATLPSGVRGYEDLKLARANEYRKQLAEELARFTR